MRDNRVSGSRYSTGPGCTEDETESNSVEKMYQEIICCRMPVYRIALRVRLKGMGMNNYSVISLMGMVKEVIACK